MLLPVTFSLQPSSPAGPSERLRAARTSEHPLGFARSHGSQTGPVGCSVSHWVYHKGVDSLFKSWQLLLCDAKDNMYIYVYIYNYIYIHYARIYGDGAKLKPQKGPQILGLMFRIHHLITGVPND
jgi:hypothetical protein